jgi:hypothetical protein
MSAIALGRMHANSAVKDLERYFLGKPPRGLLDYASAWSIREITGRDFPAPVAQFAYKSGFNLTPGRARIEAAQKRK